MTHRTRVAIAAVLLTVLGAVVTVCVHHDAGPAPAVPGGR